MENERSEDSHDQSVRPREESGGRHEPSDRAAHEHSEHSEDSSYESRPAEREPDYDSAREPEPYESAPREGEGGEPGGAHPENAPHGQDQGQGQGQGRGRRRGGRGRMSPRERRMQGRGRRRDHRQPFHPQQQHGSQEHGGERHEPRHAPESHLPPGQHSLLQEAKADVERIQEVLESVLRDLEEVSAALTKAEHEKDLAEAEIEQLRESLRRLHR